MTNQSPLVDDFLSAHDYSPHTDKAIRADLAKFVGWFTTANNEPFDPIRVTVRDVADFREHLARVRSQSVATVNRALVSVRRFLAHLVRSGAIQDNPAKSVRELRRVPTVPKGLTTGQVRKILREIELRQDRRAGGIIGLMLYGGLRVSDVVGLELSDVTITHCQDSEDNVSR